MSTTETKEQRAAANRICIEIDELIYDSKGLGHDGDYEWSGYAKFEKSRQPLLKKIKKYGDKARQSASLPDYFTKACEYLEKAKKEYLKLDKLVEENRHRWLRTDEKS